MDTELQTVLTEFLNESQSVSQDDQIKLLEENVKNLEKELKDQKEELDVKKEELNQQKEENKLLMVFIKALKERCKSSHNVPKNCSRFKKSLKIAKILTQRKSIEGFRVIRRLPQLPKFNGSSEDWPRFAMIYELTTMLGKHDEQSNHLRLKDCLEGEAMKECRILFSIMASGSIIMKHLKSIYGSDC